MNDPVDGLQTPREQVVYANLLILGVWTGILLLFVTFGLYVFGATTPLISVEDTPRCFRMGVDEYLRETGWPSGWSWASMLGRGDVLNYVGFVLLALLTILGYAVLLLAYLGQRDRLYSVICLLEIIVLGLAASGLLVAGGH